MSRWTSFRTAENRMGRWVSSLIVNLSTFGYHSTDSLCSPSIDHGNVCLDVQRLNSQAKAATQRLPGYLPLLPCFLPRFPNLPYRNNRSSVRNKRDRTSRSELRTRFGEKGGRPCPGRTVQIPDRWTVDCYRSPTTWRLPAITTTDSRQGAGGKDPVL